MIDLPDSPREIIEDEDTSHRGPTRDEYGSNPGRWCPQCHGKGRIEKVDMVTGDFDARRCSMCNGSGSNPF